MRGEILRFAENRFVVVETTVIRIENIPALAHLCPGMHRVYCHPEAAAEGSCILGMDVADRFILGQIRPWLSKIATSQAPRARTVVCPDASAGRKGECCKTGPERSIQVPKRRCSYS